MVIPELLPVTELRLRAGTGWKPGLRRICEHLARPIPRPVQLPPAGRVIVEGPRERDAVFERGHAHDHRRGPAGSQARLRAAMAGLCVPRRAHKKQDASFTDYDVSFIHAVANVVAGSHYQRGSGSASLKG